MVATLYHPTLMSIVFPMKSRFIMKAIWDELFSPWIIRTDVPDIRGLWKHVKYRYIMLCVMNDIPFNSFCNHGNILNKSSQVIPIHKKKIGLDYRAHISVGLLYQAVQGILENSYVTVFWGVF